MYLNITSSASLFYILTIILAIIFPEKFLTNKYVIIAFLSVGFIFLWAIYTDAKSKKQKHREINKQLNENRQRA